VKELVTREDVNVSVNKERCKFTGRSKVLIKEVNVKMIEALLQVAIKLRRDRVVRELVTRYRGDDDDDDVVVVVVDVVLVVIVGINKHDSKLTSRVFIKKVNVIMIE